MPFILSIIVYLGVTILGLGLISIEEILWIALFLISGFLLSKEKVWGCVFGIIPGIVFAWMSTNETGQVINIELQKSLDGAKYAVVMSHILTVHRDFLNRILI